MNRVEKSNKEDWRARSRQGFSMALTYKTEKIVEKIDAPVICVIDGVETAYESGAALYAHEFEKNYIVGSILMRDSKIVVTLTERVMANILWIGEEAVETPAI